MKRLLIILLFFFVLSAPSWAQDNVYSHKKDHKKIWRRWRSHRQSYNPYLEKKKRNKPSAIMARENKREAKRQARRAKKQKRKMQTGK